MAYLLIKQVHLACVSFSISLFVVRAALQFLGVEWRRWRVLRIAPHLVDTVLLASAIWLCMALSQYPFVDSWLSAKVFGLLAYIYFGRRALALGRSQTQRTKSFISALLSVSYIIGVALTHSTTLGFFV